MPTPLNVTELRDKLNTLISNGHGLLPVMGEDGGGATAVVDAIAYHPIDVSAHVMLEPYTGE